MSGSPKTLVLTSGKFRRRATVVEARQLTQENIKELIKWTGGRYWSRPPMRAVSGIAWPHLVVDGEDEIVEFGQWIVQLGDGNFRVWDDDDFRACYELVPVVARDEAAELRAAVNEWAEAKQAVDDADRAWTDAIDARQGVSGRQAAWTRAMERERTAELALRRLAGGQEQA